MENSISKYATNDDFISASKAGQVDFGFRMIFYFLDRFLNMALPRIRDFRGVSRSSFDGRGNYSIGIREQVIFPEIDYNQIDRIRSFQVTIATSAKTDAEAARLLELLGMPFARQQ